MPQTRTTREKTRLTAAVLHIAATQGWPAVSLDKIAKAAKMTRSALHQDYAAPVDLVPVIAEEIDREAFAGLGKISGTTHDILFDLLMARFDILQKNRKAITSMAEAARQDKKLSCALTRATIDGVYHVIDVAKIKTTPRPALAAGLIAIYGWAFFVWQNDQSRDMDKTMAALDRGLRLAGKAAEFLTRNS